jgi:FecR protein
MRSLGFNGACFVLGSSLALSPIASQTALAQANIGNTQIVVNDVKGTVGQQQPAVLRVGIDIFQNEVIQTGERSASKVLFQDKTTLSVGGSSRVTLDRFVYDPDPSKSQVALSIARGVVRFATGSLPKSSYQITTPTATIGVRGTILTILVADDGSTTIIVDDGVVIATGGGQTVSVGAGMTTTIRQNAPPTPPLPSPPAPPALVAEMDYLLASNTTLAAGPPAGSAAGTGFVNGWTLGLAGLVALGIGLAASEGNSGEVVTTTTGTSP